MRKVRFLAAGSLALFLSSLGGVGISSEVMAQAPSPTVPLDVRMTVTKSGNLATYAILVLNTTPAGSVADRRFEVTEVKGVVPEGTTMTQCWAGAGPGRGTCRFTGGDRSASWINTNTPAGTQGPFVFTVDTGGKDICSRAWVRVTANVGNRSTSKLTPDVCTATNATGS